MKTRTNIVLEDKLVYEAKKYSNVKTKKGVIEAALNEYIENHRRKKLTDLKGKIKFRSDYDYKKLRSDSSHDIG